MNEIAAENFDRVIGTSEVKLVTLKNGVMKAVITNYGARLVQLLYGDVNVIVGFDTLEEYFIPPRIYHGATIGRYANRIKNGTFSLDGVKYNLRINNAPNHLHGGPTGFHDRVWEIDNCSDSELALSYLSPHGEEGYPGNVKVQVVYRLENDGLDISYQATTDRATPFNITNHAYFNLNGGGSILNHQLQINANEFTPVNQDLIPTGELQPLADTALDFRASKPIGRDIESDEEQMLICKGYDHNFVLNKNGEPSLSFAAEAKGDKSGIVMKVFTQEPGLQLFSGNFELNDDPSTYRTSFCLETQHFPDSPNQPHFPDTILDPSEPFISRTVLRFSR